MDNLLEGSLQAGVSLSEFWGASPDELFAVARAKGQQQHEWMRTLAWFFYSCAALTAIGVNNPKKFPSIGEAFPGMFEEEKGVQDWQIMKQRVEDYSRRKGAEDFTD